MPAITAMHPQQTSLSHGTQLQHLVQRHTPTQPLRRAIYIHVSDLLSAYNIDHVKLEQELDRVKVDREGSESRTLKATSSPVRSSGASIGSASYKQGTVGSGGSHSSMGGVPIELDARDHQKRLQPPRGGHNLVVLVGKIKVVVDKQRVDRSRVRLAEVCCGDETGVVSLRARDDQIDILQAVANREGAVVLRNCTIELYQGKHIRLAVTKWGKLSAHPDHVASTPPPPSKMNQDRNFSLIDLSVVANETSVFSSVITHTGNENQHQQQQAASYHRQHSESQQQQQQHKFGNKNRNKQSNRKQMGSNNTGNITPSMQYQVVDHGVSSSQTHRYNPHLLSSTQGGLHNAAYSHTGGYLTHPSHQIALMTHPGIAHFQYHPHHPRQVGESQHNPMHHHQQPQMMFHHQFDMQHRQMQMYSGRQQQPPPFHDIGKSTYLAPGVRQVSTPNSRGYTPHQRSHQNQNQSHHQRLAVPSTELIQPSNSEDGSASLGKMNPKAASFDPSGGQRNRNRNMQL